MNWRMTVLQSDIYVEYNDGKLPVRVRPVFYDMGRYTTLFFELDE